MLKLSGIKNFKNITNKNNYYIKLLFLFLFNFIFLSFLFKREYCYVELILRNLLGLQ